MLKTYRIIPLVFILFLFGCAGFGQQLPHRTSSDIIFEAEERIRKNPNDVNAHYMLGFSYDRLGLYDQAIKAWKEQVRIKPTPNAHTNLASAYRQLGRKEEAISEYRKALKIDPSFYIAQKGLNEMEVAEGSNVAKVPETRIPSPPPSGSGSGFFVSKMGHVITNAHVVQNCNKVTIGDNANKQVPAEVVNKDKSNDLALLKLSTLEMASAESQSLIQKLGIVIVPLAANGLLRNEDVRLGEKVLVAGYPFGEYF